MNANTLKQIEAELRKATSAADIRNTLSKHGLQYPVKVQRKLVKHYLRKSPELNAKHTEGRELARQGRKLVSEANASAEVLIQPADILSEAQKEAGPCEGTFVLANGKALGTAEYMSYKQRMQSIATSLSKNRNSLMVENLLPEAKGYYVYVAFLRCGSVSFCKIGVTGDVEQRKLQLQRAFLADVEMTNVFSLDFDTATVMETMLKNTFTTARETAQAQCSHLLNPSASGYTEVMFGQHWEEVTAKAEALYLFLS